MANKNNALAGAIYEGLGGKKKRVKQLSPTQIKYLRSAASVGLVVIAAAGVVTISAIAPNLFSALNSLYKTFGPNKRSYYGSEIQGQAVKTIYYLKKHGYIRIKKMHGSLYASITRLGKKQIAQLNLKTLHVQKPKKWEGFWWLIAADIPTKEHRRGADLLRAKLKEMQFYPLQRTLWLYPHRPIEEIEFLIREYNIARYVTVMKVAVLDKDDLGIVRKYFMKHKIL